MKRLGFAGLGFLVLALAWAVFLEPNGLALGWLRGESYFDGRPASYWARELDRWQPADFWLG